ncbi:formate--tetrahydrofolate ligase [Ancylobacter amanitiformis]|uniref:Formate--tetrahydrofolate ligase n=1 Tax=Ancylobacter amanitiformis TaxID=217069 RepID=A0ABU0LKQ2_9HYPH|nr:formate--tetrahydrofolate ligase [Ancylobacter amanitiformis]MDQ0509277.1 formate--tetrahydrofolate ligase [Ancylobacter amanitiformis]
MNSAVRTIDPTSDAAIAASVAPRPIEEIGAGLGVPAEALFRYGHDKAKIALPFARTAEAKADGKLILVTAISPTPAGEGKTTTTIGLGDALAHAGKRVAIALREPSLGPVFGSKGGATGGGHAQIIPMQDINLHFTGDFHAISAAHNLLAAAIDNHVYWGNELGIDTRRINWRRVVDLNDRALRSVVVGLGGPGNGFPREDGFDITVASEVMAIFCLARSLEDMEERLGRMVVAQTRTRQPVIAAQLKVTGAMTALLRDAFQPNLVQTLEGTPALVHGGPFANIAHGCNSVMATRTALGLADYVVTEAGFGADLGAEKFLDIKCRQAGLAPSVVVIVATVRALKMHGGVAQKDLAPENVAAVTLGAANLVRHIENIGQFGVPAVVAINRFTSDTPAEIAAIEAACGEVGARVHLCTHWADGSAGALSLANDVVRLADGPSAFHPLYASNLPLVEKIDAVAKKIYRAGSVAIEPGALKKLGEFEALGFGDLPVCMAKTQYSFSADPSRRGAPEGFVLPVRDVRLSAGAGFVVVLCGEVMTMPGLPSRPAAENIFVDETGFIGGVF